MNLLPEDVDEVLNLLDTLPFDEFELETADLTVALRRTNGGWTQERTVRTEPTVVRTDTEETAVAASADTPVHDASEREGLLEVRAPLPGTFYRAPKPGAPAYADVGTAVEEDTVIGLIETMKLFNSVYAGMRGTVVEFLVNDAEFAQKDAPLALIEPAEG